MRNKNTIEFLGLWERINNPDFKGVEFDTFKNEAGLNSFTLSPTKWAEYRGGIPKESDPTYAGLGSAKGKMLGSMGVANDAAWKLALTTPNQIKTDYTFPADVEVNHLLVGPFSTNTHTMTVPDGITVTII